MLQGSLVNSLCGWVDKAGAIIFAYTGSNPAVVTFLTYNFFLFSTSNSNSFPFVYGKRSNSGHKVWLRLSTASMSMLWQMSLVGRLGSGAQSWDRIGLGDKVRVSISYCLTYMKTCSEHLIQRTALYYFNRGGVLWGGQYKITHILH